MKIDAYMLEIFLPPRVRQFDWCLLGMQIRGVCREPVRWGGCFLTCVAYARCKRYYPENAWRQAGRVVGFFEEDTRRVLYAAEGFMGHDVGLRQQLLALVGCAEGAGQC